MKHVPQGNKVRRDAENLVGRTDTRPKFGKQIFGWASQINEPEYELRAKYGRRLVLNQLGR